MTPNASDPLPAVPGLFPRTRRSLAMTWHRVEARRQIVRELASFSDRSLADMGIYRCDINEFAERATQGRRGEPLLRALAADLAGFGRARPATTIRPNAAE